MLPTPRDAAKVLAGSPLRVRKNAFNVATLVAQAAFALRNGRPKRAFLLLGAASVAPRHPGLSWLFQGALTANDIRRKLT